MNRLSTDHINTNLFLEQSYLDSEADYENSLLNEHYSGWDFVILTASNESQAEGYRQQIEARLKENRLPKQAHYAVLPDPDGKRVGSGGAAFHVLQYVHSICGTFRKKKILCIHSGGDSKRIPQYSVCGKLFSPVPRLLKNGKRSTLFDEFMISVSSVPSRMQDGMLTLSGDVLLLFNSLQIDFQFGEVAALSMKESVQTGKNHGVFLSDEQGYVKEFLHKMSEEVLLEKGAVNEKGNVDIDTGAILMNSAFLEDLYSLVDTDEKFCSFVNEETRVSFYGDFLYPLATDSTLEQFYKEKPEGTLNQALLDCRAKIYETLSKYNMKLIRLSPAEFIHFGTTKELWALMTQEIDRFSFLRWTKRVNSNARDDHFAVSNSYISDRAYIGANAYIEDSFVESGSIGENSIVSNATIDGVTIPADTVVHGIKLKNGKFVARVYGVNDNPKNKLNQTSFQGRIVSDEFLWDAKLYPVCDTIEEAVQKSLSLQTDENVMSLHESFLEADSRNAGEWQNSLNNRITAEKFTRDIIEQKQFESFAKYANLTQKQCDLILNSAQREEIFIRARIYFYLGRLLRNLEWEKKAFQLVGEEMYRELTSHANTNRDFRIQKNEVMVTLPVRVNFGGGWSDTPPYCNEKGGSVLNAAIRLNGKLPVKVHIRKIDGLWIECASEDSGAFGKFETVQDILDCQNTFDPFALHKAALISLGLIPFDEKRSLQEILKSIGGGFYLSTCVENIPRGSGLGTSSILAGACMKALCDFFGVSVSDAELYSKVLCMEQVMSTGGGWQDQVGGLTNGIKFITSKPGLQQDLRCVPLDLTEETKAELDRRFCLIYTGQRRLARNLLREVVGNYLLNNRNTITVLDKIQRLANEMKFELERDNVDQFARLLSRHWELSKQLDHGSTNTCIDQIFLTVDDLVDGKMICGAGGGGFLQVILRQGVTKEELRERLRFVFQDSGVDVWDCQILY